MTRRWKWDFEEESGETATDGVRSASEPLPQARRSPQPRPQAAPTAARRRRLAAGLILVVALAAAGLALSGSHRVAPRSARHGPGSPAARSSSAAGVEPDLGRAVSRVLAYTPFVKEGGPRGRDIALTFDDGPGPYTPAVLSVLERLHVPATFFTVGKMERYFSASTTRAIRDGDVIGDHTESHPLLAHLSAHDQHEELFEQILRVELAGAPRPNLFRPPYGSFNAATLHELSALHLLMVLWSVDTEDYRQPGVSTIVQRTLAGAHPGAIVLMHDGGGTRTQTVEALPLIIAGLRARGFRLVTVPELLLEDPPPAGVPIPPNLSGG